MLNVANKPIMLSVVLLSVLMLNVVRLSVVAPVFLLYYSDKFAAELTVIFRTSF